MLYGGTCPSCFGEVPGEETPTDPGEEVKAQVAAADQARAEKRAIMPVLAAFPLILLVVVIAGYQLIPSEDMEEMVFDEDFFEYSLDDLAKWEEPEEEPETIARAPKAPGSGVPEAARILPRNLTGGADASKLRGGSTTSDGNRAPRTAFRSDDLKVGLPGEAKKLTPQSASGADPLVGISINTSRKGSTLSDPDEVQQALRKMLRRHVPRLQSCYNRALKTNEELGGVWQLSFKVGTDGAMKSVVVAPGDMSDAEMEACIKADVESWKFNYRLDKSQPLRVPLKFRT